MMSKNIYVYSVISKQRLLFQSGDSMSLNCEILMGSYLCDRTINYYYLIANFNEWQ